MFSVPTLQGGSSHNLIHRAAVIQGTDSEFLSLVSSIHLAFNEQVFSRYVAAQR